MLRRTEGKTWQESFLQVLPMRKNAEPVESSTSGEADDDDEDEDDKINENEKETTEKNLKLVEEEQNKSLN